MLWTEKMFGVKKPIIAMLHIDPLPGDPLYKSGNDMDKVVEHAREDLHALQDGGVDGIIFSNEFSLPYQRNMDMVTPAAMAYVIGNLRSEIKVSDGGLYNNDFSSLLRRKAALPLEDLKMLYFINPESDRNLDTRPLAEIAKSTITKAAPDGLCISANAAGQDVDDTLIASVKEANPEIVVLCNTGCRVDTIERKLTTADAAVVGTTFKYGGIFENRVDVNRVKEFMQVVYKYRETL